jgi:hypothetical protein
MPWTGYQTLYLRVRFRIINDRFCFLSGGHGGHQKVFYFPHVEGRAVRKRKGGVRSREVVKLVDFIETAFFTI